MRLCDPGVAIGVKLSGGIWESSHGQVIAPHQRERQLLAQPLTLGGRNRHLHRKYDSNERDSDRKYMPESIAKMPASTLGRKHTPETRAKMSAARRGRPGRTHTPQARAKMSAIHLGKTHTKETRLKMSIAHTGIKFTPERRANISAATSRRMASTAPEIRSAWAKKANAAIAPEIRSEMMRKLNASRTPEQRSEISMKAAHFKNHVKRGIVKPGCPHCESLFQK